MYDDKVSMSLRVPQKIHDKIVDIIEKNSNLTKTDVVVGILNMHFLTEQSNKEDILNSISEVFSIENKTFMPKQVYKKLLAKSDYEISEEIKKGLIKSINIRGEKFLMFEAHTDQNAINVELLLQKKAIVLMEKRIDKIERFLVSEY